MASKRLRSILPLILLLNPRNGRGEGSNLALLVVSAESSVTSFITTPQDPRGRRRSPRIAKLHPMNRQRGCCCRITRSTAPASLFSVTTMAAGGTLLTSTLFGIAFDILSKNSGGGHIVTLLTAAVISNISKVISRVPSVPSEHFLYDWCWSIFLPASLVFALLSTSTEKLEPDGSPRASMDQSITKQCLMGMFVPFAIGSFGSILGCIASFFLVPIPSSYSTSTATKTSAILAGCLCGSYIGGTVNFFAAAKLLTPLSITNNMGSRLGSMAAADLVVMALYFAMLSAAAKSSWLRTWFPSRSNDIFSEKDSLVETKNTATTSASRVPMLKSLSAIPIAISLVLSSVFLATDLERKVNNNLHIPGTMCSFLALFGLFYNKLIGVGMKALSKLVAKKGFMHSSCSYMMNVLGQIPSLGPWLCNISFFLLFASVGTTADVTSALSGGPMALVFASLALSIHSAILILGSILSSKMANGVQKLGLKWPASSWEEILTASNASIGGKLSCIIVGYVNIWLVLIRASLLCRPKHSSSLCS